MPKVVHLTSVHHPGDSRIFYKECRSLARAGYQVVLVAPQRGEEIRDGVRIKGIGVPRNRFHRWFCLSRQIYRAALREEGELYHFHDPELLPVGWLLRRRGKKVVYDIHEDYSTSIKQKRYLPPPFRQLLGAVFNRAEGWLAAPFVQVLAEKYYARRFPRGIEVLNYPPRELVEQVGSVPGAPLRPSLESIRTIREEGERIPQESREAGEGSGGGTPGIRAERGEGKGQGSSFQPKPPRFLYTGNVTPDRGAYCHARILRLLRELEGREGLAEAEVHLVGRCSQELAEKLREAAGEGKKRLKIIGEGYYVPFHEIVNSYRRGGWTAGLALFPSTAHYREKELTKIFEYMAAGIPVLASDFPVWRKLVEGTGSGICVSPHCREELEEALCRLISRPEERSRMGRRGQEAVWNQYNWETQEEKLVELYRQLLNR